MDLITVDGHTYTKEDITALREDVIGWRDESYKQWPDAIPFTLASSHLIALLAHVIEQYPTTGEDEYGPYVQLTKEKSDGSTG